MLEATWAVLRDFIAAVYESHASSHSYQELYAAVEAAVIGKLGGAIYERLLDRVAAQVEALVGSLAHSSQVRERPRLPALPCTPLHPPLCATARWQDPAAHLGAVQSTWALHCRQTVTVRNVFLYLDRTYVRDTAGARPLWDVAMDCYRAQLLARPELLARIVSAFVALVTAERNGETVDRPMLSAVTRMCMALKLYGSHMQPALYACTDEYFASEGLACMASMDVPEYLAHVERRLTEERDRVLAVMDAGSLRAIIASAEESLVTRHRAAILEKGFNSLLDHRRSEVLRRLYGLMARVGKVEELRQAFLAYARVRAGDGSALAGGWALQIIRVRPRSHRAVVLRGLRARGVGGEGQGHGASEGGGQYTLIDHGVAASQLARASHRSSQLLLDFKRAMDDLIASAFHNNDTFLASLKSALEFAVNQRENKPAELVGACLVPFPDSPRPHSYIPLHCPPHPAAKFIDQKMRGGARGAGLASDREVEDVLDAVMVLFRCMYGKDVFEAFYKKDLAKRLLLNKSASIDLERSMISKLKTECGANFTAKLEGMFRDMESSRAILDSYAVRAAPAAPSRLRVASPAIATAAAAGFAGVVVLARPALRIRCPRPHIVLLADLHHGACRGATSGELARRSSCPPRTHTHTYNQPRLPAAPSQLEPCLRSFHAFYQSKFSTSRKLQWQHQLGHCLVRAAFPSVRGSGG